MKIAKENLEKIRLIIKTHMVMDVPMQNTNMKEVSGLLNDK